MRNHYFMFKQFTIWQDKCAMKVSTDACVAGAWTPVPQHAKRVLDIGAGTGLLPLMLAQRNPDIEIDAIELDNEAAAQAKDNVRCSPWSNRIHIIHADAATYNYSYNYDFIISNPPFFNNSLLGNREQRNRARHTIGLSYRALFRIISENLTPTGCAAILLPLPEFENWEQMINQEDWHTVRKLVVYPSPGKRPNRIVGICCRGRGDKPEEDTLLIRETNGEYTRRFGDLMAPFYLNL